MVENSTRVPKFYRVPQGVILLYWRRLFNYKNYFVRGSRPEVFCNIVIFTRKHLCRSFFFNKVNRAYFHFLILQVIPSEAAVYKWSLKQLFGKI